MFSFFIVFASSSFAFVERKGLAKQDQNSFPSFHVPTVSFKMNSDMNWDGPERSLSELQTMAMSWASENLQLAEGSDDKVLISRAFTDSRTGLHHCYMLKESQGLEIVNSVAQLTMTNTGSMVTNSHSWVKTDSSTASLVKRDSGVDCTDAIKSIAKNLKESVDDATMSKWKMAADNSTKTLDGVDFTAGTVLCKEKLYQTPNNLVHVLDMTVPTPTQYLNVMVDKATGKIVGANDWTSHISFTPSGRLLKRHEPAPRLQKRASKSSPSFRALQLGALDPRTVSPSLITDPIDFSVSPNGWTDRGQTIGNNAIATDNSANQKDVNRIVRNGRQVSSSNFNFDFQVDDANQQPSAYTSAAITNAFFLTNRFHDVMAQYGFDEKSGNFQQTNSQGGKGSDPVVALVHDGSGKNNANFGAPPDGQPGVMRMFIFDRTTPNRDGALENAVVLHELTHGVSNRLTGGADNANCLSTPESGGLGEGWSDIVAIALEMEDVDTDKTQKVVGQYVTNDAQKGVRQFAFSTDTSTNPLKYSDIQKNQEVHAVGEIWTAMLFEVYWNMVNTAGFDKGFRTNPQGSSGNNQFMKTLLAAMKIQPCNPSFVQARDAMFAADQAMTGGKFQCEMIRGFAKRGLGANVQDNGQYQDDNTVPAKCRN